MDELQKSRRDFAFLCGMLVGLLLVTAVWFVKSTCGGNSPNLAAAQIPSSWASPDGRFSIRIEATDAVAGIWIVDNRTKKASCLYVDPIQGPVAGVWGPDFGKNEKGMAAALVYDESGGRLQLLHPEERPGAAPPPPDAPKQPMNLLGGTQINLDIF